MTQASEGPPREPDSRLDELVRLGRAHLRSGHWEAAGGLFEQVLALDPGNCAVRLDLAWSLIQRDALNQARSILAAAALAEPSNPVVTHLLLRVLSRQRDWAALRVEMLRRVEMDYAGAEAEWERSCVNLAFGVMPGGWDQHESRWELPGVCERKRNFTQPLWAGEAFVGKTLLLHCEQGFGDTLMFVRYAPRVKVLGGRVLLLAQPELTDLVETCEGVDEVIPEGEPLPPFDLQLPLLSLPRVFRTEMDSIPAEIPYLSIPERVPNRAGISNLLARSEGRTRIGVLLAGNRAHVRDAQRSVPPEAFAPLGELPGVSWHGFRFGEGPDAPLPRMALLGPHFRSFSDTAYALSGMDLVITVDTALAHLAGALGIPTLLMVSFLPDWRWMLDREDSPWYPTMRIYRQPNPGDWESVVRDILQDLS